MRKLIKPRSQVDVEQNRGIVAEYISGLVEAAKQIQSEETGRTGTTVLLKSGDSEVR